MTKKELKKLRKSLPPGAIKTLAEKFGHTPSYISMILSGKRNGNAYVISAATTMADEYQALVNENNEKIKAGK
jgi:hypothetical protein